MLAEEGEGGSGGDSRVLSLDVPKMMKLPLTQGGRKQQV